MVNITWVFIKPAAGSKYLLDLYQPTCHIYKVIFSLALGRKANAALDFCLQGLKSFTLDSCHAPDPRSFLYSRMFGYLLLQSSREGRGEALHGWGTDEQQ